MIWMGIDGKNPKNRRVHLLLLCLELRLLLWGRFIGGGALSESEYFTCDDEAIGNVNWDVFIAHLP